MSGESEGKEWGAVIGRSLAFLCLIQDDLRDKGLVPQAKLLEALGLSRKDAASILETTEASLAVLLRRERNKEGGKGGAKKRSSK